MSIQCAFSVFLELPLYSPFSFRFIFLFFLSQEKSRYGKAELPHQRYRERTNKQMCTHMQERAKKKATLPAQHLCPSSTNVGGGREVGESRVEPSEPIKATTRKKRSRHSTVAAPSCSPTYIHISLCLSSVTLPRQCTQRAGETPFLGLSRNKTVEWPTTSVEAPGWSPICFLTRKRLHTHTQMRRAKKCSLALPVFSTHTTAMVVLAAVVGSTSTAGRGHRYRSSHPLNHFCARVNVLVRLMRLRLGTNLTIAPRLRQLGGDLMKRDTHARLPGRRKRHMRRRRLRRGRQGHRYSR